MENLDRGATESEARAVAEISAKPMLNTDLGTPIAFIPDGYTLSILHHIMPAPQRQSGNINADDVDSFIALIKRYGSPERSAVYVRVDETSLSAVAVLNEHGSDGLAGWRDYRAVFLPKKSTEWEKWIGSSGSKFNQISFAHFMESNAKDIVSAERLPSAGDVLAFVSRLEDTRKVKYGSSVNLQNGMVQIEFIEAEESGTKGKLELFKEFAIGIRPFQHGQAYQVRAWLRYSIDRNSGAITFWYELQQTHLVIEDASKDIVEKIKIGIDIPVYFGVPD